MRQRVASVAVAVCVLASPARADVLRASSQPDVLPTREMGFELGLAGVVDNYNRALVVLAKQWIDYQVHGTIKLGGSAQAGCGISDLDESISHGGCLVTTTSLWARGVGGWGSGPTRWSVGVGGVARYTRVGRGGPEDALYVVPMVGSDEPPSLRLLELDASIRFDHGAGSGQLSLTGITAPEYFRQVAGLVSYGRRLGPTWSAAASLQATVTIGHFEDSAMYGFMLTAARGRYSFSLYVPAEPVIAPGAVLTFGITAGP
jgi:hypothetical protein